MSSIYSVKTAQERGEEIGFGSPHKLANLLRPCLSHLFLLLFALSFSSLVKSNTDHFEFSPHKIYARNLFGLVQPCRDIYHNARDVATRKICWLEESEFDRRKIKGGWKHLIEI